MEDFLKENEILQDFSQSPALDSYQYDWLVQTSEKIIDELSTIKDPETIIRSRELCKNIERLYVILSIDAGNRIGIVDQFRSEDRYSTLVDLYIWILKNFESIGTFSEFLYVIIVNTYKAFINLDFDKSKPLCEFLNCYTRLNINERKLHLMCRLANLINILISRLIELRFFVIKQGSIDCLIKILDNDEFLRKLSRFNQTTIDTFVYNINWMSKVAEGFKSVWHDLDAIRVLIKVSKAYLNMKLYLYMATVNIAYDKEIEDLVEIHEAVQTFVDLTLKAVKSDKKIKQEFIDEHDQSVYEVGRLF